MFFDTHPGAPNEKPFFVFGFSFSAQIMMQRLLH